MIRRLRPLILITGTLLSVLIVAAFVVSGWWWLWVEIRGGTFVGVHAGAFVWGYAPAVPRGVLHAG